MKAQIVPIGNSKGIRIPKPVLEQCKITNEVELSVQDGVIVIEPVLADDSTPRRNWGAAFARMHEAGDDELLIDDALDVDDGDWTW